MSVPLASINRLVPGLIEPTGGRATGAAADKAIDKASFAELFSNLVNSVNELQHDAGQAEQALMAGEPVELHEVMIKAEQAGLTMDLLLEIRNKLLSAYTEIMRMPM